MRIVEGYWPTRLSPITRLCVRQQRKKRQRFSEAGALRPGEPAPAQVQAIGQAGWQLRLRFPPDDQMMPSALGNALSAMEYRAGSAYGWDAIVTWPRLHPLLPERVRATVDDRGDALDAAVRLCATGLVSAAAALALLALCG
ncbi:hypothetical protein ACFZA1_31905 [Streptomyces filipinensis]|uniref:hypothetical protein n=1 Tax=Streptomyces filipinensis TaxID=66887 RepID=UPI0036E8EFC8